MGRFSSLTPYLLRYRKAYAVGAVCVVLTVALRLTSPRLLGETIGDLAEQGATPAPDTRDRILLYALLVAGAAAVGALIRTTSRVLILGSVSRYSTLREAANLLSYPIIWAMYWRW